MYKVLLILLLTHTICLQINYGVDPKKGGGRGSGGDLLEGKWCFRRQTRPKKEGDREVCLTLKTFPVENLLIASPHILTPSLNWKCQLERLENEMGCEVRVGEGKHYNITS